MVLRPTLQLTGAGTTHAAAVSAVGNRARHGQRGRDAHQAPNDGAHVAAAPVAGARCQGALVRVAEAVDGKELLKIG